MRTSILRSWLNGWIDKISMRDFLIRGVAGCAKLRFALCRSTNAVFQAVVYHDADPVAAELIGDAVTGAALSSVLLGEGEKLSIRWEYPGAAGITLADVNFAGDIRCCPGNPHLLGEVKSRADLFGVGDGNIAVTRSSDGRILNSGQSAAPLADLSLDLAFFYSVSDQVESGIKSIVELSPDPVKPVKTAGGLLIQALPDCDLEEFEEVRRRLESAELEEVLSRDVLGVDVWVREVLEALLKADFGDSEISYSYGADIGLRCSCSEEKMASALKLLSPEELEAAWSGRDELTVQCQFCGRRYTLRRR